MSYGIHCCISPFTSANGMTWQVNGLTKTKTGLVGL